MAYMNFFRPVDMRHFDMSLIAKTPGGHWLGVAPNSTEVYWEFTIGTGLNAETDDAIHLWGTGFKFDHAFPNATRPVDAQIDGLDYYDPFKGYSWTMGRASFHLSDFLKVSSTKTLKDDAAFMTSVLSGPDSITGSSGSDVLNGFTGADILKGGDGSEYFVFSSKLVIGAEDSILDFNPAEDHIELDNAVFTTLKDGALKAGAFYVGSAAHDANDRIIYDPQHGELFYDKDGSGKARAIGFANVGLDSSHAPTWHDLMVI